MIFKICSLFAAMILVGTSAEAGVIDFNSLSGTFATYTEQGVTFSPVGGGSLVASIDPNGTIGLLEGSSPRHEIRADIVGGTASVSIDLGDFDADPDTLFLEIFNTSNLSLGFTSLLTLSSDSTMHTLTLSDPNIAYAIFGGRAPASGGSSVYADNFTFDAANGIPEPGALFLTAGGVAGLLLRRRIRKG